MSYTYARPVALPYDDAVAAVRTALADQGFGVLTEIDVRATLQAKLGVEVPAEVILGACRPQLAHAALQADPSIAAMLPCNVVVRATDDGCLVEAADPAAMMQVSGAAGLADVADEAGRRIRAAVDAVAGAER